MKRFFKFEATFGWGEMFALLAFFLSVYAVWDTRRQALPNLIVTKETPIMPVFKDVVGPDRIYAGFPVFVTNRGGRAASLIQIEKADNRIPMLLRVHNGRILENANIETSCAVLDGFFNSPAELAKAVTEQQMHPLKLPHIVNKKIDSGEMRPMVFTVVMKDSDGKPIGDDMLLFMCQLKFSDGTTHLLSHGFGYVPPK
jgi:hypothetical protein